MSEEKDIIKEEELDESISPDEVDVSDDSTETSTDETISTEREVEEDFEEKNYLSPSIFEDIKEFSRDQLGEMVDVDDTVPPEILSQYDKTLSKIAEHQIVQGRVIGQNEKEIIMDIGFKSEGIIPRSEFVGKEPPAIGDVLGVYLERMEDENGQTLLSKEKADWMQSWNEIMEIYNKGETIKGKIIRRIKGGMVVEVNEIQAFLPGSQIDVRPVQDFDQYLNQEMEFKIVKVNRLRKNIVLSRKVLLEDSLKEQRDVLFQEINVGQILEGRVKNITDFGAFIDLGGIDGLLHITDLSWGRVNHPSEIVELGEMLNVKIIDVDRAKQRVSLGLKQLTPHPWEAVPEKYPIGNTIKGKVVSMTNYGAFVEIEKGVEGLVHVSEMSWTRSIYHPSEMVQLGDEVEAQVLSVNPKDRKIALGFKQLQPDPWDGVQERYSVGSLHKGVIRNLRQFGAFIELEVGVEGLIHISDLSWTKLIRHPKEILEKGQEVEVRVLEVLKESRRIALGLKQTIDDPWPAIKDHFAIGKKVPGKVIRILDKGLILELEMDVEGIVPSRSFPRENRKDALMQFSPGMTVSCEVLEVKSDDKKIALKVPDLPSEVKKREEEKVSQDSESESSIKEVEKKTELETSSEESAKTEEIKPTENQDTLKEKAPKKKTKSKKSSK